jgi:hypothetical protein
VSERPQNRHLKPFPKGRSGNPSGRPKDVLTQALRTRLTPEEAGALADRLIAMARGGDLHAMKLIWDRVEGRPLQRSEQDVTTHGRVLIYLPDRDIDVTGEKLGLKPPPIEGEVSE